jgi:hypothetical protein
VLQALPPKLRLARGLCRTGLSAAGAGAMLSGARGASARAVVQCAATRRQRVRALATPLSRWGILKLAFGRTGFAPAGDALLTISPGVRSMKTSHLSAVAAVAILAVFSLPGAAAAARARYRYVAAPTVGDPAAYTLAGAEKLSTFGTVLSTGGTPPRATNIVSYRHPYTGRAARVPIAFPLGTPNIQYRGDRVVYDYDTFAVSVRFLPDGSVEVTYDSGFLRDI